MIYPGLFRLSPAKWITGYKILAVLLLCVLWLSTDNGLTGLFLVLFLTILILLRWRLQRFHWTLLLDQLIGMGASFSWENGAFALALSVFEAMGVGKPFLAFPTLIFAVFYKPDPFFGFLLLENLLLGLVLCRWQQERTATFFRLDVKGKKELELESLKEELLAANIQVARMAELSERSRIAREIHDHAGHEIVAAYMSLQTAEQFWTVEPAQARELFKEGMQRLENGIAQIRTAVHNLSPLAALGVDSLQRLCANFTFCPVDFQVYGDTSKVPLYQWSILEPCLKEAFTNIIRHTRAEKVVVTLDITPYLVRLCVENDGVVERTAFTEGLGLRNLRQRAKAAGGTISTDTRDGFRLICVLPLA